MNIDTDLLIEIFSRVPVNSIIRCKLVCREWYKILSDPDFSHNYAKNPPFFISVLWQSTAYSSDNSSVDLVEISEIGDCFLTTIQPKFPGYVEGISKLIYVGSCNGLMCFMIKKQTCEVYICNPMRGDFFALPPSEIEIADPFDSCSWRYQFGFCPCSNNFKVLRLSNERWMKKSACAIFTVGVDKKWRRLAKPVPPRSFWGENVFFNGSFHFIGWHEDSYSNVIFTFHIGREEVGQISHPRWVVLDHMMYLGSYNNKLFVVDNSVDSHVCVWIMQEYGVEQSWAKTIVLRGWVPVNFGLVKYFLALESILTIAIKCSYSPCFAPLKEVIRNASSN